MEETKRVVSHPSQGAARFAAGIGGGICSGGRAPQYNTNIVKQERFDVVRKCYQCGNAGHIARQCPQGGVNCFRCQREGHIASRCPLRKSEPVAEVYRHAFASTNREPASERVSRYRECSDDPAKLSLQ